MEKLLTLAVIAFITTATNALANQKEPIDAFTYMMAAKETKVLRVKVVAEGSCGEFDPYEIGDACEYEVVTANKKSAKRQRFNVLFRDSVELKLGQEVTIKYLKLPKQFRFAGVTVGEVIAENAPAPVEVTDFYCTRDDDADDWTITIDLKNGIAELFDNDTFSEFRLDRILEVFPPIYLFENPENSKEEINFRIGQSGSAIKAQYVSKHGGKTERVAFTCTAE